MKAIVLTAALGTQNIQSMANPEKIDEALAYWTEKLQQTTNPDKREASVKFIVDALESGEHHRDKGVAYDVTVAQLWVIANGNLGPVVMPFLRRGEVIVKEEITRIAEGKYNFRTTFDEKTSKALELC